ncbi:FliH/SctL family protein [Qipengyuania sp. ASV99]|uniref:FliH/SctL family protein n=1 Tax=Qipengyuania sp. ASV99 TaxID=3399681 RepID=UPI003A4C821B
MLNSSDWFAALHEPEGSVEAKAPDWIDQLTQPGGFVEGGPFGRLGERERQTAPAPEMSPAATPAHNLPEPDPLAEAFARGEAAGRAAAAAEHTAVQDQQRALRLSFRELDQTAMDSLAGELAETVIALCEQALSEFVPEPGQLLKRCHAAARRLGSAAQDCALHLNPADIDALARETRDNWRVVADDTIARGGLKFETSDGSISDGPSEWRRAIATALRG